MLRTSWALLLLVAGAPATAADVGRLEVEREDDGYRVIMEAEIAAPVPAVWSRRLP